MRDQVHRIKMSVSIASTTVAAAGTTNGSGVDTLGYQSVTLIAQLMLFTNGTDYSFLLQDAPDNATWTTIPNTGAASPATSSLVIGGTNLVDLGVTVGIGLLGVIYCQRFVRAVCTVTGGTVAGTFRADILLGNPVHSGVAV